MLFNYSAYNFLGFCCLQILALYPATNAILNNNEKYRSYNIHRKLYIIKNIIKSFFLAYLSLSSVFIISDMYYDTWNNWRLNKFATLYVANDIMGLLLIPKLPFSTQIHHITTTLFLLYSYTLDFTEDNVGRLLVILCIFSSYSFMVNLYLGLRFLKDDKINLLNLTIEKIRYYSYYVYKVCCFFNWTIQSLIILNKAYHNHLTLSYLIYPWFLILIINDDLVLMNWLKNKTI